MTNKIKLVVSSLSTVMFVTALVVVGTSALLMPAEARAQYYEPYSGGCCEVDYSVDPIYDYYYEPDYSFDPYYNYSYEPDYSYDPIYDYYYEPDYSVDPVYDYYYEPDYSYDPGYYVDEYYNPGYYVDEYYTPDYSYFDGYYNDYYAPTSVSVPSFSFNYNSNSNSNVNNNSNTNIIKINNSNEQKYVSSGNPFAVPTCNIYASPQTVNSGNTTTLIWNSYNATSASLSGFGSVSTSGSRVTPSITGTRVYTLTVSGEGGSNSCSTTIDVVQQVPSCTIYASPSSVDYGDSTTVTWNSYNADNATLTDAGSVSTSGSRTFNNLTSTKTYTLNVSSSGGSNSCSTTVYVDQQQQTPSCSLYISPSSVSRNGSATISWSSYNATSASIDSIGSVSLSGSRTIYPDYSRTYTMTVWNNSGQSNTCSGHVNVDEYYPYPGGLSCTIRAYPSSIRNGESSVLSWTSYGASSAWLSDGIGTVSTNGSRAVYPSSSRGYTLTVRDWQGRTQTCYTNVNVSGTGGGYIYLTQIPYTGFDFGPFGNTMYWFALIAWALGAAYIVVRYRGEMRDLTFSLVRGRKVNTVDEADIVSEAIVFDSEEEATPEERSDESPEDERTTGDNMNLSEGTATEMPHITINRN